MTTEALTTPAVAVPRKATKRSLASVAKRLLQPPAPIEFGPILPNRIRYALKHRGAELDGPDIESLYFTPYRRAGFYLAIKAADSSPATQAEMLRLFGRVDFDYGRLTLSDLQRGTEVLKYQPPGERRTVLGEKLGQLSRHGISYEIASFDQSLAASAGAGTAPVFMVANYPYIAIDVLAKYSLHQGQPLGVINPDNLNDSRKPAGLLMAGSANNLMVEPLPQDYKMPEGSIIFDDIVREGTTRALVLNWTGETAVSFVTTGQVTARF